jgi:GNAT superfamily N-acetyltransferase
MTALSITIDLARRLESAEAAFNLARLRALSSQCDNAAGVEIAHFGRAVCMWVRGRANNPSYNRVLGFSEEDASTLEAIVCWFRQRGLRMWFDVAPLLVGGPTLERLTALGLRPARFFSVLCIDPVRAPGAEMSGIDVRRIAPDRQAHDFAVPFCTGYGIPAEAHAATERNLPVEYSDPGWRIYVAYVEGQPASVACLHLESTAGCIAAMATAPPFRRRGCQSALLRRCIADSASAGCQLLAYQTGPGSDSERNVLRAGFQVAYTKLVLSPSGGGMAQPSTTEQGRG